VELITISIVTIPSILAQLCGRFFTFWSISNANFRILWLRLPT